MKICHTYHNFKHEKGRYVLEDVRGISDDVRAISDEKVFFEEYKFSKNTTF